MAKAFNKTRGEAQKGVDRYKFNDGENTFRIVSGIIPRYTYWAKTADGNVTLPLECLGFDREKEKFTNIEKDWVRELVPKFQEKEMKNGREVYKNNCGWAYCMLVINRGTGKVELCDMKKTLWADVQNFCRRKNLDPTDFENGVDIVAIREKTGPKPFDVKYSIDQLATMESQGPISDDDRQSIADFLNVGVDEISTVDDVNIEELVPRPTADEQREFILAKILGQEASEEEQEDDTPDELDDPDSDDI